MPQAGSATGRLSAYVPGRMQVWQWRQESYGADAGQTNRLGTAIAAEEDPGSLSMSQERLHQGGGDVEGAIQ